MRISPRQKPLELIQRSNIWLQLKNLEDRKRIEELLSFWKVSWYRGPGGSKRSAKKVTLISPKGFFLAGFLELLRSRFNIALEIAFKPSNIVSDSTLPSKVIDTIRYYQKDALETILTSKRGVVVFPTGTGKTLLAVMLLASMPKARALFVVHTLDLMQQTVKEFRYFLGDKSIGWVGDGEREWRQRTVAMVQSLKDYNFRKNPVDVVIVDEVHHSPSDSYQELLKKIDCPYRVGLTATPRKDDEGRLKQQGMIGPVVYDYPYAQAVKDGYLAEVNVKVFKVLRRDEAACRKSYRKVYDEGIINHPERNEKIVKESMLYAAFGKSVLVIVKEVKHGEILKEAFGDEAKFIYGKDSKESRLEVKELLEKKEIGAVICTGIFDEGINIPSLDVVVIAGAGQSRIKSVQRPGRGTRVTDEKDSVTIVDFMDMSHKFLKKHSRERIKVYESCGWNIEKKY